MQSKKQLVWLYYGYQFFLSLLLWLPIFYEYQKRMGLSDSEIFRIQSIYYIVFCVLEIPTGMIADRWGYIRCMRWGAVVLVFANVLPCFVTSYGGVVLHFIGVALSRSLGSGASSAYLYEYLRRFDAVTEYKRAEGNARAYGLLGKVVCWAGIGLMMQWHVTLPYWLTALSAVVAVIFAFWMPALSKINGAEAASEGTAGGVECLKKEHSARLAVFRVLWGSPFLVLLMFQGAAIFVLARIGQVNLFQPILAEKTFGLPAYGVVMSMMTVFEALGSLRHQDLRKWLNDLNAIFVLSISAALSLGLIPFVDKVGAVILLCLLAWSSGVAFPMQRQLINDAIMDSRFRATLLSMESILDRAICSIVAWLLGWYLGFGSLDDFLIISALIITGVMVVLAGILFTAPRLKLTRSKVTSVP